jgi:hypothetical protein
MPRPRSPENLNLPKRWTLHHGAYFYQVPPGAEKYWNFKRKFRLGETLDEAMRTFEAMTSRQQETEEAARRLLSIGDILSAAGNFHREGVYFLISNDEVVYVGRSSNIYERLGAHVNRGRIVFDRVHTMPAAGLEQERLEQLYIAAFAPKHNVYGTSYEPTSGI